jgi:hypothetical protein
MQRVPIGDGAGKAETARMTADITSCRTFSYPPVRSYGAETGPTVVSTSAGDCAKQFSRSRSGEA